jgi:hypothetical protein
MMAALVYLRKYDNNDSLVDYLLVNAENYGGDVQLWAIYTLKDLGARATKALPVLRRIKKNEAS